MDNTGKPLRFEVEIYDYHNVATTEQRDIAAHILGNADSVVLTALWAASQMFSMYGFNVNNVLRHAADICHDFLYGDFIDIYEHSPYEAKQAVLGISYAVKDMYPVVICFAEARLNQGYSLEHIKGELTDMSWDVAPNQYESSEITVLTEKISAEQEWT